MTINERVAYIMKEKAGGSLTRFSEALGITTQYATRLIKTGSVGIEPITRILQTYPDINSRWLITNEGFPFDKDKDSEYIVRSEISRRINLLLDLERWIPAMSETDLQDLLGLLSGDKDFKLDPMKVSDWEHKVSEKERQLNERVTKAMKEGVICRTQKDKP